MEKKNVCIWITTIILFVFSIVSCKSGDDNNWGSDVRQRFNNAKYIPELNDIVPEALGNSSLNTTRNVARNSINAEYLIPVVASTPEFLLDWYGLLKQRVDDLVTDSLDLVNQNSLSEPGQWNANETLLYDSTEYGTLFIKSPESISNNRTHARISLKENNYTEVYHSEDQSDLPLRFYSDFVNNDYLVYNLQRLIPDGGQPIHAFELWDFDEVDGLTTGKIVMGHTGYINSTIFIGDKIEAVVYSRSDSSHFDSIIYSFHLIRNGLGIIYSSSVGVRPPAITMDIGLFENIDRIEFSSDPITYTSILTSPPLYITKIILKDGTELPINLLRNTEYNFSIGMSLIGMNGTNAVGLSLSFNLSDLDTISALLGSKYKEIFPDIQLFIDNSTKVFDNFSVGIFENIYKDNTEDIMAQLNNFFDEKSRSFPE